MRVQCERVHCISTCCTEAETLTDSSLSETDSEENGQVTLSVQRWVSQCLIL